jgi:NTP pyrophosphatase (non-canonical NTP hydrolase)
MNPEKPTGSGDYSIGSPVWPGMSKVIEEMGELAQVLGKLMGTGGEAKHWDGSNLRERLIEELADLHAAIQFFANQNLTIEEQNALAKRAGEKWRRFDEWHAGGTHGVAR